MKSKSKNSAFDLANNLHDIRYNVDKNFDDSSDSSIKKIHINNHKKALTEEIHDIENLDSLDFSIPKTVEDSLWKEIEEAVQENDIADLRANLNNITKSGGQVFNDIQIDQYLDNELCEDLMNEIKLELESSDLLQNNVTIHREVNEAISETDIMDLRQSLSNITEEESMIKGEKINQIDDYLQGLLIDDNLVQFEDELNDNQSLRNELNLQSEINDAIQEDDIMDLRASLGDIVKEEAKSNKQFRIISGNKAKLIGAAASVAAVVSIGAFTFNQKPSNFDEIYSNNYKPYDATGFVRSATTSMDVAALGVDLYNQQNYKNAIEKFKTVLDENKMHPMCNFYSGLSCQQLENYESAITFYSFVIQEKDNLYVEQAEWYMALCLLKTEEKIKGVKLINDIAESNSYYKQNAKELLRKIR